MIYIVMEGEGNDSGVVATTTNREVAEKIRDKVNSKRKYAFIDEYVDQVEVPLPLWIIGFDKSGKITRTHCEDDYSFWGFYNETEGIEYNDGIDDPWVEVKVRAENKKSAIKIAKERRNRYLTESIF